MATSLTPIGTFHKFHQFTKIEDGDDDDKPTVYGVSTWEHPDSDNECCSYEAAKPVYQAWSAKALKRTKGAGQEPSLGNLRIQHGSDVGGKVTKLVFDDVAKEILLGSEPVNDDVYKMLKGGFLTGYSQGGSYAWRCCMTCDTPLSLEQGNNYCPKCNKSVTVMYGLKRLAEVSYVDSPAIGEGFEHVKANGSTEIVKFAKAKGDGNVAKTKRVAGVDLPAHCFAYVGDPEKTETWKLPINFPGNEEKSKTHIRNALARFDQTRGIPSEKKEEVKAKIHAAATSHGIDVTGDVKTKSEPARSMLKARIDARVESVGLKKGLYAVGRLADVMETLACLWEQTLWERDYEGDESDIPEELQEHLEGLVETFIAMATEEARELAARTNKTEKGEQSAMTQEELDNLTKAAKKSLAHHFAKSAAHHEKMADHHEATAEHHETLADAHKAAHESIHKNDANRGSEGEARGSDDHMTEPTITFHKAAQKAHMLVAGSHMKKAKAHKAMCEHCTKMSESHDEEESKKVMKSEKEAYDLEKKATPAPAPVVNADANDFIARATKQAQENLMKNPEFIKELEAAQRAELLGAVSKKSAEALASQVIEPTAVKFAGTDGGNGTVTRVDRGGSNGTEKFTFSGGGNSGNGSDPF